MPAGACAPATRPRQAPNDFVERLGYFLTLVGLTSLIVGGAGIANAVSAFVNRRTATIATLKCLGAPSRTVFGIYLTEILIVAVLAIAIGVLAGALVPALGPCHFARHPAACRFHDRIEALPLLPRRRLWLPRDARLRPVAARPHASRSGLRAVPASHRARRRLAGAWDHGSDRRRARR